MLVQIRRGIYLGQQLPVTLLPRKAVQTMSEVRKERFQRVAAARTAKTVAMLRLLGNCADPRSYSFAPDEAQALLQQIEKAVTEVRERFAALSPYKGKPFKLGEPEARDDG